MARLLIHSQNQILGYDFATVSTVDTLSNSVGGSIACRNLFARLYDGRLLTFDTLSGPEGILSANHVDDKLYYDYGNLVTDNVYWGKSGIYAVGDEVLLLLSNYSAAAENQKILQFYSTDRGKTFQFAGGIDPWPFSASSTTDVYISKIHYHKGAYYAAVGLYASAWRIRIVKFTLNSNSWVDIYNDAGNGGTPLGGMTADIFSFKDRLFVFFNFNEGLNGYFVRLDEIVGNSLSTIFSQSFANVSYSTRTAIGVPDNINDRIVLFANDYNLTAYAWRSDSAVTTITQDNTLLGSITQFGSGTSSDSNNGAFYRNGALSNDYIVVTSSTGAIDLYSWNGTQLALETTTSSTNPSPSIIEFEPQNSYSGIRKKGLAGSRFQLYIRNMKPVAAGTTTIDPRFSKDNGFTFSPMTIDESKTGWNNDDIFDDDFSVDKLSNDDHYLTVRNDFNVSVTSGVLRVNTQGVAGELHLVKRFLIDGAFSVNIGFGGLGSALAAAGTSIKVGIRAYFVGSQRRWYDPDNYAEIYAFKDDANASLYQANQRIGGSDNLSSTVTAPVSGESPAMHIDRDATGNVSLYYGTTKTILSTPSSINSLNRAIIEIFVINTDTSNVYVIDFDNFSLASGTAEFIGGVTGIINWDFQADGIIQDTAVIVKNIAS